jgi:hypothetical protein
VGERRRKESCKEAAATQQRLPDVIKSLSDFVDAGNDFSD